MDKTADCENLCTETGKCTRERGQPRAFILQALIHISAFKLSVKLIMDYSGEKRVGLFFVHKKRPDESD